MLPMHHDLICAWLSQRVWDVCNLPYPSKVNLLIQSDNYYCKSAKVIRWRVNPSGLRKSYNTSAAPETAYLSEPTNNNDIWMTMTHQHCTGHYRRYPKCSWYFLPVLCWERVRYREGLNLKTSKSSGRHLIRELLAAHHNREALLLQLLSMFRLRSPIYHFKDRIAPRTEV